MYFTRPGEPHRTMRALLDREAAVRARRFGIERRDFLGGAMGALTSLAIVRQWPRFRSRAEAQQDFVPPVEACYEQLQATHASFRQSTAATSIDWEIIHRAAEVQQRAVADTVLNMMRALGGLYGGFGVSQLVHMTQTATRARRANASDELVLLGLLHDAGEIVNGPNHGEFVAGLLRPYVSDAGYRLVRTHMEFQLKHYGDAILQPTDMRERYAAQPWYADAARFSDEWDQMSFDPAYDTMPLEAFEPLVRVTFSKPPEAIHRPATDCLGP